MDPTKQFGLVMPKMLQRSKIITKSIFESDSDDDVPSTKRPKIPQKKIKIKQENVEDPSIYEYDSIYDEMKAKQAESVVPKEKKNSRYIDTLLKAADKRKKEYERRVERKIQVEREKEGDQFKDKEEFVTSTYKKKMQEREEEEERERREAMLNDMMDVTKQKDLSGFYRHFLNQTVGEEKMPTFGERSVKKEVTGDGDKTSKIKNKFDSSIEDISIKKEPEESESSVKQGKDLSALNKKNQSGNGNTKKIENVNISKEMADLDRDSDGIEIDTDSDDGNKDDKTSNDDDITCDSDEQNSSKHHKKTVKNSDKGKKESINIRENNSDSSSGEYDNKKRSSINKYKKETSFSSELKRIKIVKQAKTYRKHNSDSESENHLESKLVEIQSKTNSQRHKSSDDSDEERGEKNVENKEKDKLDSVKSKPIVKRNIYEKRTVGDVFAQAQARYFQRMADQRG